MSKTISTSLAATSDIGLVGWLTAIDGDAFIGALAGAALVVTSSKDSSRLKQFVYLFISTIAGYFAAPEVVRMTPMTNTGISAFIAAALAIAITRQLMERVKSFDFFGYIKRH